MNDLETVRLPKHGQSIEIKFPDNDLIGTLVIGDEELKVYLGDMKAEQLGRAPVIYQNISGRSPAT